MADLHDLWMSQYGSNTNQIENDVRQSLYSPATPINGGVEDFDNCDTALIRIGRDKQCHICYSHYKRNGVMYYVVATDGQSYYTCNEYSCKDKLKEKLNGNQEESARL